MTNQQPDLGEKRPASVSAWLLAFGLTISTATQFRIGELPLGPGEFVLALWTVLELPRIARARKSQFTGFGGSLLLFWLISLAACCIGWIIATVLGRESGKPVHDFVAYVFAAGILFVFVSRATYSLARRVAVLFVSMTAVSLGLILAGGIIAGKLGPMDPWWGGVVFRGWAKNPSQITVQVAAIPFLAHFLFASYTRRTTRLWMLIVAVVAVVVGLWTLRDAIAVAWLFSAIAFFCLRYFFNVKRGFRSILNAAAHAAAPIILVACALVIVPKYYNNFLTKAAEVYYLADQGPTRLALWDAGLRAAAASPLFGLGPGPHSELPPTYSDVECHNSLIDWTTCSGLIGLAAFLWLMAGLFRKVWRTRDADLVCALLAILALSMFHYTFRQPNFWFTLVFINAFAVWKLRRGTQDPVALG